MKIFSFIENIRPVNSSDAGSIREIHEAVKGLLRRAVTETTTEDVVEVRGREGRQKIVIRESNTPFIDILPPGIEVQVPIIGGIGGLGAVFLHFPSDFDSLETDEDIIKSVAKPSSRVLKGHKTEPIRRKTLMEIGNLMRRVLNSKLKHEGMADSGAICIRADLDPNDMAVEI